ncbi:MAG: pentose-5-phosphate-3-epimerase [Candidatus Saccharimonadales bacterium]|jgi:pentose-5-phosphate-3-epimerase
MNKKQAVITPTITTDDPHEFRDQMTLIGGFADGVHLDFSDGVFSPSTLLHIKDAWRSDDLITHAHVMYQDPYSVIAAIENLEADLVILHAESDNVKKCLQKLSENGTRAGIALLPDSDVSDIVDLEIDGLFEHVLVFGGRLGFQGSDADMEQLNKIKAIKKTYPGIEIGWDGGVNDANVKSIVSGGVDVVNVGGHIKNADKPQKAYDKLVSLIQS